MGGMKIEGSLGVAYKSILYVFLKSYDQLFLIIHNHQAELVI